MNLLKFCFILEKYLYKAYNKKTYKTKIKREISFLQATSLGLGALIGAGIFVLIGPIIQLTGSNALFVYILAGFSAFLSALTYAELAKVYSQSSGGYAYARDIVGRRFGFITGWLLVTGSMGACAVYAIGFAELLQAFISFKVTVVALLATILICIINISGTSRTAKMEYYFTIVLTLGILGFALLLMTKGEMNNFHFLYSKSDFFKVIQGVNIVYISFFGFQVISASSDEVIDHKKNVPKAIITSILIASLIYILIIVGVIAVRDGRAPKNSALILQETADLVMGKTGSVAIAVLGILATLTSLNATFLAISRRIYNMAKDRYIPELLAKVHPKFQTPHLSLIFILCIVIFLIFSGDLTQAASLSAFSYLGSLIFVHAALIFSKIKHKYKHDHKKIKSIIYYFVPALGIGINLVVLLLLDLRILITGFVWTLFGMFLYVLLRRREVGLEKIKRIYERLKLFARRK